MYEALRKEIDTFISGFSENIQYILKQVRNAIKTTAQGADGKISYAMPVFILKGNLVYFTAFENHIGFYPASSGIRAFKKEPSIYKVAKGSVQFPRTIPKALKFISTIVKFKINENIKHARNRKKITRTI